MPTTRLNHESARAKNIPRAFPPAACLSCHIMIFCPVLFSTEMVVFYSFIFHLFSLSLSGPKPLDLFCLFKGGKEKHLLSTAQHPFSQNLFIELSLLNSPHTTCLCSRNERCSFNTQIWGANYIFNNPSIPCDDSLGSLSLFHPKEMSVASRIKDWKEESVGCRMLERKIEMTGQEWENTSKENRPINTIALRSCHDFSLSVSYIFIQRILGQKKSAAVKPTGYYIARSADPRLFSFHPVTDKGKK